MKNTLLLITLLISTAAFSQGGPKSSGIDSSTIRDGVNLLNWKNGVAIQRGSVIGGGGTASPFWNYDSIWGTLYSIGAKDSSTEAGRWNFVAMPLAGRNLTNKSSYNVAIGPGAMQLSKLAKNTIAIGWEAAKNTNGTDNVAISEDALYSHLSGFGNNAIGRGAMFSLNRGSHNNAFGYNALQGMIKGDENVVGGSYAMAFNLAGYGNVAIGTYAMENNDHYRFPALIVTNSTAIGYMAGFNSLGSNCINIGSNTETVGDNKINIGNTIYGDRATGNVSVKSISISDRQVTFDDNYMYVQTSTGTKKVPLQEVTATTRAVTAQSNQRVAVYGTDGKLVGFATFQLK